MLAVLTEQINQEINSIGIETGKVVEVKENKRLSSAKGRCTRKTKDGEIGFIIEINPTIIRSYRALRDVIAHELIHTVHGCFNHGKQFKIYCESLNRHFGWNVQSRFNYQDYPELEECIESQFKYVFRCDKCGYTVGYNRKNEFVKHPEWYSHCRDGGKFIQVK